MTKSLLEAESAAVLPARDTMLVVSIASVQSRINANSAFVSVIQKGASWNSVTGAAGATVGVSQSVTQNAVNVL